MKYTTLIPALLSAVLASACHGQAAKPADQTVAATAATPATPGTQPRTTATEAMGTSGDSADQAHAPLVLAKGMTADVAANTTLTFVSIVSDSRCPKGVQCIWAGEVTIALKLVTPGGSEEFELSTDTRSEATVKGYDLAMVGYGPCPGGPAVTPLPGECASITATPAP